MRNICFERGQASGARDFFVVPVPHRPVVEIGERGKIFAGIDGVGVADGGEHVAIGKGVSVGVTLGERNAVRAGKETDGIAFRRAVHWWTEEFAGPEAVTHFESGGTDMNFRFDAASFEFTFESGGSHLSEWLERTGDENEAVILASVPEDASDSFSEDGDFADVAIDEVTRNVGKILFVSVANGGDTSGGQEAQGFEEPAEIIGEGNFVIAAESAEEAEFERGFGDEGAVEIEEGRDAAFVRCGGRVRRVRGHAGPPRGERRESARTSCAARNL